jgi:protein involved in polysaccharide export with SLBB domain
VISRFSGKEEVMPKPLIQAFGSSQKNWLSRACYILLAGLFTTLEGGCAAMTNPVDIGIPVRLLPPELLAKPKDEEQTIPLSLLGQKPPGFYLLAPEDTLGVWIEGVVGDKSLPLPVHIANQAQAGDVRRFPPAVGYPIQIQGDGKVSLPLIEPITVQGMTTAQAEATIRKAYTDKGILPVGRDRVLVSLMQPRQYKVVVMRQETPSFTPGPTGTVPTGKRGTGVLLDLLPYENDVLHALAQSGGLPSLDVYNEIVIFRGFFQPGMDNIALQQLDKNRPPEGLKVVKIPLRANPGEPLNIHPDNVILQSGDVVFLEARDKELFYTGGLLPAGEFILPRDRDLDVVQAIMQVRGPIINGAFGTNSLSGTLIQPGIGNPSPTLVTVLRKTCKGEQVAIRVDLGRALQDPRERLKLQAGDMIFLQEKPSEAMTRYFTQTFFNFELAWRVFRTSNASGVIDIAGPDRIANTRLLP